MPIFDRFKGLFKGSHSTTSSRRIILDVVRVGTDPWNEWRRIKEIGDGAFGKVVKVSRRVDANLIAASKMIEIEEGEMLEDMLTEVEILDMCKRVDVNVVGLLDAYFYENKFFLMLEFCGGGAVDAIMLDLGKPLTEPQIAYITHFVCVALDFLHANGVIHRDLKAGNILLTDDANVRLADFGVSALMRDRSQRRDSFIGSPYWMAPEVMRCETLKDQPYDCLADIWSLGITLIEMSQTLPPNHTMNHMRVLLKVQRSDPPGFEKPSIWTPVFRDFATKCLQKTPQERKSASDLLQHSFIRCVGQAESSFYRRSVVQLLAEKNADFQDEEVVMYEVDEEYENDGSVSMDAVSRLTQNDTVEEPKNQKPAAASVSATEQKQSHAPPLKPQNDHPIFIAVGADKENHTAAASSATTTANPVVVGRENKQTATTSFNCAGIREMDRDDSEKISEDGRSSSLISPSGQEAIDILEDLYKSLDNDYGGKEDRYSSPSVTRGSSDSATGHAQRNELSRTTSSGEGDCSIEHSHVDSSGGEEKSMSRSTRSGVSVIEICAGSGDIDEEERKKGEIEAHVPPPEPPIDYENEGNGTAENNDYEKQQQKNTTVKLPPLPIYTSTPKNHGGAGLYAGRAHRSLTTETGDVSNHHSSSTSAPGSSMAPNRLIALRQRQLQQQQAFINNNGEQQHQRLKKQRSGPPEATADAERMQHAHPAPPHSQSVRFLHQHKQLQPSSSSSKAVAGLPPPPPYTVDGAAVGVGRSQSVGGGGLRLAPGGSGGGSADKTVSNLQAARHKQQHIANGGIPQKSSAGGGNALLSRKSPQRSTVTRRTRTYTVEGVQVSSTTLHVLEAKQDYELRKKELRDLRRMQREESRQQQELSSRADTMRENQERKFGFEKQAVTKTFDGEMETLAKAHKKRVEELERQQEEEMRDLVKRIRVDHERELRLFRDRLRQEQKALKAENDQLPLPKAQRRANYTHHKEKLEKAQNEREAGWISQLERSHEHYLDRTRTRHRENLCQLERQCLEQKQQLERNMEGALWELEESQLGEKHVLLTQQLRDVFHLQRSHMLHRHAKELEHVRRVNQQKEEELLKALTTDRKGLPKSLRAESKTRSVMFRESLRIDHSEESEHWHEMIRQFEEREKQRIRQKLDEYDGKCRLKLARLIDEHKQVIKELEDIQNEKRNILLANEREKLAEYEREYQQLVFDWKASLPHRKAALEARFAEELAAQANFYENPSSSAAATSSTNTSPPAGAAGVVVP